MPNAATKDRLSRACRSSIQQCIQGASRASTNGRSQKLGFEECMPLKRKHGDRHQFPAELPHLVTEAQTSAELSGGDSNALRSIETPRLHHAARWCCSGVAARGARAAGGNAGGSPWGRAMARRMRTALRARARDDQESAPAEPGDHRFLPTVRSSTDG